MSHPGVCRVHDIGEDEGCPFLTMEWIEGEDLAASLRCVGRFPPERVVLFASQMLDALGAIHAQGLLHRDLKPANVLLDRQGWTRLLDFGLAALAGQVREGDVRSGTPAYMAPEHLAGREVSARSDLFSLGLVPYEAATGRHTGLAAGARCRSGAGPRDPPLPGGRPRPPARLGPGSEAGSAAPVPARHGGGRRQWAAGPSRRPGAAGGGAAPAGAARLARPARAALAPVAAQVARLAGGRGRADPGAAGA
ncbi:MAG: serine/threonine protein kinase [Gemmataceae bacterium]|nr:serine/threonine protein kinase [Gemmataceae bacterium]